MNLNNPFPLDVRLLFIDSWECWECGENGQRKGGLELHHIWGRISASALNAAPLCKVCHNGIAHNIETHQRLLRKTIHYLSMQHYRLTEVDDAFLACVQLDLRGFSV